MTINRALFRNRLAGAATMAMLAAPAAFAQGTLDDLPSTDVLSPDMSMDAIAFPVLEDVTSDQAIIDSLSAQGYKRIRIIREGEGVVVAAERANIPTEMLFSATDGRLLLVDGIEPPASATN
ncbi:hypothetical protein [Paracoccus sp. (in: a-proteobacteria)]|uniref:hypothetical protein n=1 Tax=Paracoccus sp. TaxID=267 RepID=UPI00396C34BD